MGPFIQPPELNDGGGFLHKFEAWLKTPTITLTGGVQKALSTLVPLEVEQLSSRARLALNLSLRRFQNGGFQPRRPLRGFSVLFYANAARAEAKDR